MGGIKTDPKFREKKKQGGGGPRGGRKKLTGGRTGAPLTRLNI